MGLDFNGLPKHYYKERALSLTELSPNAVDGFLKSASSVNQGDSVFDGVAAVYLKGEALKEGLANMNPSGFIPVETTSSVVASIQRISPKADSFTIISFGLFKEACEYLSNSSSTINEDFVLSFTAIDSSIESNSVSETHKKVSYSGNDWISEFLNGASTYAGLMLAGFMGDIFGSVSPRVTAPSNEPKQWYAQGLFPGIALLIELGVTYAAFKSMYSDSKSSTPEVENAFIELSNDPAKRKETLDSIGYDYESLRNNQKYNDYKAIKRYAITYIDRHKDNASYDHWIAWLQTLESQSIIKNALAMAPSFSNKWSGFYDGVTEDSTTVDTEKKIHKTLSAPIKEYLNSLITLNSAAYDKTYQAFSFGLDEQTLCCILYFLGPLNDEALNKLLFISNLSINTSSLQINSVLNLSTDGIISEITSMAISYLTKAINELLDNVFGGVFTLSDSDLEEIADSCIGIDWLLSILDEVTSNCLDSLSLCIDNANFTAEAVSRNSNIYAESTVERKVAITYKSLLSAIVNEIQNVQDVCQIKLESGDVFDNNRAAEAAVDFVATRLPSLYPILSLSEEDSRKYFSSIFSFTTPKLGIEVGSTNDLGSLQTQTSLEGAKENCADNLRATKNLILGRKFAEALKNN